MTAKKTISETVKAVKITKSPLKKSGKPKRASSIVKTCFSCPCFAKVKKPALLILLLIIFGLAASLYFFKNQFIVAIVDGKPISRLALIKELEKQGGKQTLDRLVTEILILKEAKNQNIDIGPDEINQEVEKIKQSLSQQGQKLDQLLESRKMTRDDLIEEIKIQKIVEKLASKNIEVTDEEVSGYIEENKNSFPEDINIEEIKEDIKQQLKQQKINQEIPSWIQSLHDKAKIKHLLEF